MEEKKEQKEEISKKKQQQEEPSTLFDLTPYRIRELKKQKKMMKIVRQEMLQLIAQKKEAFMLYNIKKGTKDCSIDLVAASQ